MEKKEYPKPKIINVVTSLWIRFAESTSIREHEKKSPSAKKCKAVTLVENGSDDIVRETPSIPATGNISPKGIT